MPRLLAMIPEDGWAMVNEGKTIYFIRPPFRSSERVPVSEATVADAIAIHGYQSIPDAPEESWTSVVARIREVMANMEPDEARPTNAELLSRILHSSPLSVLQGILDKVEKEWLGKGDLRSAAKVLYAMNAEERIKNDTALLHRTSQMLQKLNELHDEKARRIPLRPRPPRIELAGNRPSVQRYKERQRGIGPARMVGPGT